MWTFTAKTWGMWYLDLQSELCRGSWIFGMRGWKYMEIGQLFFSSGAGTRDRPFWKAQKERSKIAVLAIQCISLLFFCLIFGIEFNFEVTHTTTIVSQYRKKNPTFLCLTSRFLGIRDFSESTAYIDFCSQYKGHVRSWTAERIVSWELIFWNVRVKIRGNRPAFFSSGPGTPDRPFWTPFLAGKSANPSFEGTWKAKKERSKIALFWPSNAFYRFSFARSSV